MRTAHKVWSGVAAGVFVLVAATDCGGGDTTDRAAAARAPATYTAPPPPPPRDPMLGGSSDMTVGVHKTVRRVIAIGDVEYTDGTRARLDITPYSGDDDAGWEKCADRLRLAAAHRLLDGKTVTAGRDDTKSYTDRRDWIRVAYAPYAAYSPETDYTSALSNETTTKIMDECYPQTEPAPAEDSGSSVSVDSDDDNHRDGALTGGYCRKRAWC